MQRCSAGDERRVERCALIDGCPTWLDHGRCPEGSVCVAEGECQGACPDPCPVGSNDCVGETWRACESDGDCSRWVELEICVPPEQCDALEGCVVPCEEECFDHDALRCVGERRLERCRDRGDGCWQWALERECEARCAGNRCELLCESDCTVEGARECDGTFFRRCEDVGGGPSPCLQWSPWRACGEGLVCVEGDDGPCEEDCVERCEREGATRCASTTEQQTCIESPCGFVWAAPERCRDDERCVDGACSPCELCFPDLPSTRCSADRGRIDVCDGACWVPDEPCIDGSLCWSRECRPCAPGLCAFSMPPSCEELLVQVTCELLEPEGCNFLWVRPCPAGTICRDALGCIYVDCFDPCRVDEIGNRRCSPDVDGTESVLQACVPHWADDACWVDVERCAESGLACVDGECR